MRGFQLWLNLPAAEKMQPAHYQDLPPEAMPTRSLPGGGQLKLIAGSLVLEEQTVQGPIHGGSTQPLYVDLHLGADEQVQLPTPAGHTALLYVYEGAVAIDAEESSATLTRGQLGLLSDGEGVSLTAQAAGTRLLLMAARPIGEPVVQYGPFVMNTEAEIRQAVRDYQLGQLTD